MATVTLGREAKTGRIIAACRSGSDPYSDLLRDRVTDAELALAARFPEGRLWLGRPHVWGGPMTGGPWHVAELITYTREAGEDWDAAARRVMEELDAPEGAEGFDPYHDQVAEPDNAPLGLGGN